MYDDNDKKHDDDNDNDKHDNYRQLLHYQRKQTNTITTIQENSNRNNIARLEDDWSRKRTTYLMSLEGEWMEVRESK